MTSSPKWPCRVTGPESQRLGHGWQGEEEGSVPETSSIEAIDHRMPSQLWRLPCEIDSLACFYGAMKSRSLTSV